MNSCDLCAAARLLRNQVQVLRQVALTPEDGDRIAHPTIAGLLRQVARRAREVEAWGSRLKDSCALAAAAEAYQVLAKVQVSVEDAEPAAHAGERNWLKAGAVVLVHVVHDRATDPNQLTKHLMPATLDLVLTNPPCTPFRVSVGLLAIDDQAALNWHVQAPCGGDSTTTVAPLLVTALFREGLLGGPVSFLRHLQESTHQGHFCRYVPRPSEVNTVVVPLPDKQLVSVERRCIGPLVSGRYRQH